MIHNNHTPCDRYDEQYVCKRHFQRNPGRGYSLKMTWIGRRQAGRQTNRQTYTHTMNIHTDRQTDRRTDRQTYTHTIDIHTDRQTDRQTAWRSPYGPSALRCRTVMKFARPGQNAVLSLPVARPDLRPLIRLYRASKCVRLSTLN